LRRFFLGTPLATEMFIHGQDAHHISRVLRLQVGDTIVVVAPDGQAATAQIKDLAIDQVTLFLQEAIIEQKEAPVNVYLAQGLPKNDKMDYIVQKAVELGVKAVYPIQMEHSVVQYDSTKKNARRERWQKLSVEAAKQCGRALVPTVEPIQSLAELLAGLPEQVVLIMLYEGQATQGLKQVLAEKPAASYLLLVGPEGGFSAKEVALCQEQGACIVTIGPRILRTETASLAGVAMIMYEYGDLGG
jgi:16S rRNA (uracil1498-N3)-methyltransferase